MTTMKDVAKRAGVSVTTVSHVINETRFVSDELQRRVFDAMEELHYRPNILARSLRRGETRTIGLIVPDNSNPFFAEVARTVEDIGFENGYSVILCNTDGDLEKEKVYIDVLIAKQVDGAVFIAAGSRQEHLSELTAQGLPVVVVDRDIPQTLADVVLVNNEQGGYEATRHLIELGHQRIGCIAGPSELTPSAARIHGYRRALEENDLPYREELIVSGDFRYDGGETTMEKLLSLSAPPTAVFVCNDIMAIGALRAIKRAQMQVPADLSIIGFDNIPITSATSPALTTVAQPITELGVRSMNLLLSRIRNTRPSGDYERIILETELTIRDSCAEPC